MSRGLSNSGLTVAEANETNRHVESHFESDWRVVNYSLFRQEYNLMERMAPCLPNPDSKGDPSWTCFSDYLSRNSIDVVNDAALNAYQNGREGRFLNAGPLNHCLNLMHFGADSDYERLAEDQYGTLISDWAPDPSISALDRLFSKFAYRFNPKSVVYKGIGLEPFYEVLNIPALESGEKVFFPGFLSTSVSREKAESFSSSNQLLLTIRGLDQVKAIVPPNRTVLNTLSPNIPEQEILLNRGTRFVVAGNCLQDDGWRIVDLVVSVKSSTS